MNARVEIFLARDEVFWTCELGVVEGISALWPPF
jgi:hypothetical protein